MVHFQPPSVTPAPILEPPDISETNYTKIDVAKF